MGEGGLQILPGSRLADDGKRFQAMDVVLGLRLARKFICVTIGQGSGEGVNKFRLRDAGGFCFTPLNKGLTRKVVTNNTTKGGNKAAPTRTIISLLSSC